MDLLPHIPLPRAVKNIETKVKTYHFLNSSDKSLSQQLAAKTHVLYWFPYTCCYEVFTTIFTDLAD